MGGKGKDRKKKKSAQSARQAAQRRAVQQRTAERRVRDLRFRLLSARDASAAAGRLTGAFADRDRVSCAYDAEATVSSAAGRIAQAGFAGDRLRDVCLDICDALAASSAPTRCVATRCATPRPTTSRPRRSAPSSAPQPQYPGCCSWDTAGWSRTACLLAPRMGEPETGGRVTGPGPAAVQRLPHQHRGTRRLRQPGGSSRPAQCSQEAGRGSP